MRTSFEPSHPAAKTERIFVVDSDEIIRSALQFILDDRGETYGFKSLDRAFANAADPAPDIVMLGLGLLQNDGEVVLGKIATCWPAAKVLIVTNSVHDPLAIASLKWGAHDLLGRPITFDTVHRKVDVVLGRHEVSPTTLGLLPLSAAW